MRPLMKQTQVTRRRFVTAAAVGLGATAAPALLTAQDKKPIRIGGSMAIGEHLDLALWGVQDAQLARSARERVFAIFPDLREKERAKARTMSGGQRQMLVFAMALMRRPELILLDEPTIGLAPKVIDSIFECLGLIHRQGVSILLVEQNAAKALAHSQRAYVLDMGQNRYEGRSADLLADSKVREMYLGAR